MSVDLTGDVGQDGGDETPSRGRVTAVVVLAVSATAALFHMYAAGIQPFTALVQRPVHLALMATLGFLGVGVQKTLRGTDGIAGWKERLSGGLGWILAGLSIVVCAYLAMDWEGMPASPRQSGRRHPPGLP